MTILKPSDLPDWPRRMKAPLAAAYLGVSETKFQNRVGKEYPEGRNDGANVLWDIRELDEYVDRWAGGGTKTNPFMEGLSRVGTKSR